MISIKLYDFLQTYPEQIGIGDNNRLVNLRGTNGSGKSSVPFSFINTDSRAFELTYEFNGRNKVLATVCPTFGWLFIGAYRTKCGGLDGFKGNDQTADTLEMVWNLPYNILMEGVISSTVYSTYSELFKKVNADNSRHVTIVTLAPPVETCLARIQIRNGGKPIKSEQVEGKYRTMLRNHEKFTADGFECLKLDNSKIKLDETRDWFLTSLGMPTQAVEETPTREVKPTIETKSGQVKANKKDLSGMSKDAKIKEIVKDTGIPEEMYLPTSDDLDGYAWAKYYKEPNQDVVINWNNMRMYWYWIAERMNVWYERTILRNPKPWTSDKILQEYSFTNVIRDLDKGTILYINNILKKIDEPVNDLTKRKKEIVLNTMIYRLFIRKETMDTIGWFFELDKWDEQWTKAKAGLRKIKKSGEPVFHNAYYINDLHAASPSPDNHDKTENAINLIETFWKPRLDEIYEFITTHDMKDTLEFLSTLCCVGLFTAYEWVCDFALCHRHTVNTLVDWDDDSYVNIGPGNKRGLDYIFVNKGNLNYYQCNFYLRASWKHYMQRYGYYDRFIDQLPEFMCEDINMRVIEHDLCETSKYLNAYYEIGRPKAKFANKSEGSLDGLLL